MILAQPSLLSAADLAAAVRLLSNASALVIGDAVLDRTVFGMPAAGQVLREDREVVLAGGAGSVVRHLTALGAATAFITVVGDDPAGTQLTTLIGGQPNVEPWLLVEGECRTAVRTRYYAAGRLLLQAERPPAAAVDARLAERILRIARDSMAATSVTVLSDHGNGLLTPELAGQLAAAAKAAGRRVVADGRAPNAASYAEADVTLFDRTMPDAALAVLACGLAVGVELPVAQRLASLASEIAAGRGEDAILGEADLLAALSAK